MKKYRFILLATVLVLLSTGCKEDPEDPSYDPIAALEPVAKDIVLPLHERFLQATEDLWASARAFELQGDSLSLIALQERFMEAHEAWKGCEAFDFGEVRDLYLHNRIGKWPMNEVLIEQAISGSDNLTEAFVEGKGSTAKGLSAIEYMLFDRRDSVYHAFTVGTNAGRRLQYTLALCENLRNKARELNDFWATAGGSYASRWANSTATGIEHPIGLLLNRLIVLQEQVCKDKLGKPMGKFDGNVLQPGSLEAGRSGNSLALLRENVQTMYLIFKGPQGKGGLDGALDELGALYNGLPLSDRVAAAFSRVLDEIDAIKPPLSQALNTQFAELDLLYADCKELLILMKSDMASALSVTLTISDNDGD